MHGCKAMSLTDGSPVGVVLADDDLDLAVLAPAQAVRRKPKAQPQPKLQPLPLMRQSPLKLQQRPQRQRS